MKKNFKFFSMLGCSFNPKRYNILNKTSLGVAFIYITIISIILGITQGIFNLIVFNNIEKEVINTLNKKEYEFSLQQGTLDFKQSPFKFDQGQLVVIIDTTKTINDLKSLDSITIHKDNSIVLLKDGFSFKSNGNEITNKYNDIGLGSIKLDNNKVIEDINKNNIIKFIVIPIVIIMKFIDLLIYGLLISLVGILFNLLSVNKTKYGNIFKLSLYAATIPTIISIFIPIGTLGMIIGGVFLSIGLGNIKYDENIIK